MKLSVVAILLCGLMVPAVAVSHAAEKPEKTIKNLKTAVEDEANASHRYTLFARRADEEGYPQVGKLFRAAAKAESVHQRNAEKVLRDLGVEPKTPKLKKVKVSTTSENLGKPVQGENKETEEIPSKIKQAQKDNVPEAVTSFTYALNTEREHAQLFRGALAQLGHNPRTNYYVSEVSGETVTQPKQQGQFRKVE